MDTDKYGMIINGPETYSATARLLRQAQPVVLNWGDQDGTMLNILLTYNPIRIGAPGGKIDNGLPHKLWVGVAGMGTYAFAVGDYIDPGYVGEKIGFRGVNPTTIALADLLSGIGKELAA